MSLSATSKSPEPARLRPSTTNLSAPAARPSPFLMSLRLPPIIISAIEREDFLRRDALADDLAAAQDRRACRRARGSRAACG